MRAAAILGRPDRRLLPVAGRQKIDHPADLGQRLDVVVERQIGDARALGVGRGAAQLLVAHLLLGHGPHHVRAGHEHVRAVAHHDDEVGHRRRVDRAAGAGPHDHADLRHDARGEHVALEHVGVAREARDAFLDARAAGIVQPDHRRADLHRLVHDLADLLGVRLGQRAAEHREVLAEHEHQAAVDGAGAGHHAIARDALLGHAELGAAMLDEHVDLLERAEVEQQLQPLARRQLAALVLGGDAPRAATELRRRALGVEPLQNLPHRSPSARPARQRLAVLISPVGSPGKRDRRRRRTRRLARLARAAGIF